MPGDIAARLVLLLQKHGHRRVALLVSNGLHGDSGVEAMTRALDPTEVELVRTVRLPRTGADFRPAVRKLGSAEPDGVIVWGTTPDTGTAARTLRATGYRGPLYFDAAAVADDTLSTTNAAAVEGAHAVHPTALGSSTLTNTSMAALARRDFVFRYIDGFGEYNGFAPYASDALTLITEAARFAGSVDRGRIRAFLRTQTAEGMAGAYAFQPSRHSGQERTLLAVYTVDHRGWTRVS